MIAHHRPLADAEILDPRRVRVRVWTAPGDVVSVVALAGDRYRAEAQAVPLPERYPAGDSDVFEGILPAPQGRLRYLFALHTAGGCRYLGPSGLRPTLAEAGWFHVPYAFAERAVHVPAWLRGRTVYQIFVDRFARSRPPEPDWTPWDSPPSNPHERYGGDLRGIRQRLGELAELGIGAIYLTPVFRAGSNHKYDTIDYGQVDPWFGTERDLVELARACHESGIGLILDAVFNHVGREHPRFRKAAADPSSPDRAWFVWRDEPPGYETFADVEAMPKLATWRSEVQDELLRIAEHWTKALDLDGWRLDVADEVAPSFWRRFRAAIKALRPEAWILGEVWHDPGPYLQGDLFDAVTDYLWREAVIRFWRGQEGAHELVARLGQRRALGRSECGLTLLGSHDTPRIATLLDGDRGRVLRAFALQMSLPGTPQIYYGDEVGLLGGPDPDSRRPMPATTTEEQQRLRAAVADLVRARSARPWLTDGPVRLYPSPAGQAIAVWRGSEEEEWLATISGPLGSEEVPLPDVTGEGWQLLLGQGELKPGPTGWTALGTPYAIWTRVRSRR